MFDCFRIKKKKQTKNKILIIDNKPTNDKPVDNHIEPHNNKGPIYNHIEPHDSKGIIYNHIKPRDSLDFFGKEITIGKEYLDGYKIIQRLRCSNGKSAYIVQNKKSDKYILKIKNDLSQYEEIVYNILVNERHPNIQQVIMMYTSQDKYCFIYEYIEGYDLYDYVYRIGDLSEQQMKHIIRQVIHGLKFLHENNIVHVDLKCENILFNPDTNEVKIIDFDLSVVVHEKSKIIKHTLCGTEPYVAPETIKYSIYSPKTDVWQLGVVLYVLVTEGAPCEDVLNHECDDECKENMLDVLGTYIIEKGFDHSLHTLLEHILVYDEYTRWTLDQILESTWLNN